MRDLHVVSVQGVGVFLFGIAHFALQQCTAGGVTLPTQLGSKRWVLCLIGPAAIPRNNVAGLIFLNVPARRVVALRALYLFAILLFECVGRVNVKPDNNVF